MALQKFQNVIVDVQRVQAFGAKEGESRVITVDAISYPNKRWNIGGGAVGTGIPPSIIAQWLASGRIRKRGVLPPESCIEREDEELRKEVSEHCCRDCGESHLTVNPFGP